VPGCRTALATDPPLPGPRGRQTVVAPRTHIDVPDVVAHLDDRGSGGRAPVPAAFRVELIAVDRDRAGRREVAHGVEGMYGHVQQQWMLHHSPETIHPVRDPELRRDKAQRAQPL